MAHNQPVTIKGLIFRTQKDALEHFNVSRATVNDRLKKGMTIDEAYTTKSKYTPPKNIDIDGISFPSLRQACIHYNKSVDTVKSRIANGATYEEALTMPDTYFAKNKGFKGNNTIFRNKEYRTEKDACIAYNVSPKAVNVYKHRHNLAFNDALEHYIERGNQINGK